MCRMVAAAKKKTMPSISLVGDQPLYALMVQLKNENTDKFEVILVIPRSVSCTHVLHIGHKQEI